MEIIGATVPMVSKIDVSCIVGSRLLWHRHALTVAGYISRTLILTAYGVYK